MLKDLRTTTYKEVNKSMNKEINLEEKNIVKDKIIANRILVNDLNECFISLKDHKPNFTNNPKTRVINPTKMEIGRFSKSILDNLNSKLRNITSLMETPSPADHFNMNKTNEQSEKIHLIINPIFR